MKIIISSFINNEFEKVDFDCWYFEINFDGSENCVYDADWSWKFFPCALKKICH